MHLKSIFFLLFVRLCSFNMQSVLGSEEDEMIPKIGIIGAGIGGTSCAYWLKELFGEAKLDIFEASKVGGRASTVKIDGLEYEAGASIIHGKNKYMSEFLTKFLGETYRITKSGSGELGLFDNNEIFFKTNQWTVVTLAKLMWRYGLDFYNLQTWTKNLLLSRFERIYSFQEKAMAFTTLEDLLKAMGEDMLNMTRYSIREVLQDAGISDKFIDEIVTGAVKNNYGQNLDIHGFVGSVAMVGSEPDLWAVENGNKQVAMKLLEASSANLIKAKVVTVTLLKGEHGSGSVSYEVKYQTNDQKLHSKEYDLIIMATPFQGTQHSINFEDFPNELNSFNQDFHKTVAMFVQGNVNTTTFSLNTKEDFPSDLFVTTNDSFFNSIGEQTSVTPDKDTDNNNKIYKVFLNKVPSNEQVDSLFTDRKDLRLVEWLAYPEYKPNMDLPPFVLYDKFYYVNAIESAASAFEMSCIGARNVALLAFNHWNGIFDKIDEYSLPSETSSNKNSEL